MFTVEEKVTGTDNAPNSAEFCGGCGSVFKEAGLAGLAGMARSVCRGPSYGQTGFSASAARLSVAGPITPVVVGDARRAESRGLYVGFRVA